MAVRAQKKCRKMVAISPPNPQLSATFGLSPHHRNFRKNFRESLVHPKVSIYHPLRKFPIKESQALKDPCTEAKAKSPRGIGVGPQHQSGRS